MALAKGIEMEHKVVDEISADELMKHTAFIAEEDRLSGSEGEARAVCTFILFDFLGSKPYSNLLFLSYKISQLKKI